MSRARESGRWFVEIVAPQQLRKDLAEFQNLPVLEEVPAEWASDPIQNRLAISTDEWAGESDASAVRALAKAEIEKLNEQLQADSILYGEVQVGGCVWRVDQSIDRGFTRAFFLEVQAGVFTLAGLDVKLLVNGKEMPAPRTRGHRAKELAGRDVEFLKANIFFKEAGEDIRVLWLCFEYAKARFGEPLYKYSLTNKSSEVAFRETANERGIRHRLDKRRKPYKYEEMTGPQAREFIREILNEWLDRLCPV